MDFLNPILLRTEVNSSLIKYFQKYLRPDMAVYDIGCGAKPFAPALQGKVKSHIGVDIADGFYDPATIDLIGSAYEVPVEDGAADAVILSQVIEHLERPRDSIKEMSRILKKDGLMFLSFPFLYPIHAEPRDYFRYTEYGAQEMLNEYGFEILEKTRVGGFWFCVGFFLKIYLQAFDRGLLKKIYVVKILTALLQFFFLALGKIEETALKLAKKNVSDFRATWTANYILVARKK